MRHKRRVVAGDIVTIDQNSFVEKLMAGKLSQYYDYIISDRIVMNAQYKVDARIGNLLRVVPVDDYVAERLKEINKEVGFAPTEIFHIAVGYVRLES